jgi:hypothetical protein
MNESNTRRHRFRGKKAVGGVSVPLDVKVKIVKAMIAESSKGDEALRKLKAALIKEHSKKWKGVYRQSVNGWYKVC